MPGNPSILPNKGNHVKLKSICSGSDFEEDKGYSLYDKEEEQTSWRDGTDNVSDNKKQCSKYGKQSNTE